MVLILSGSLLPNILLQNTGYNVNWNTCFSACLHYEYIKGFVEFTGLLLVRNPYHSINN